MAEKESSIELNITQNVEEDTTVLKVLDNKETFTLFPKLASELRIKVWSEALHLEEVLIIDFVRPDNWHVIGLRGRSSVGKAHVMAVNREARFEAVRVLKQFRGGALFNPITDVAWFSQVPSYGQWGGSRILDKYSVQLNAADQVYKVSIETEFTEVWNRKVQLHYFIDIYPSIAHVCRGGKREVVILLGCSSLLTETACGEYAPIKAQDKYRGVSGWVEGEFESWEVLGEKLLAGLKEFQALDVVKLQRYHSKHIANATCQGYIINNFLQWKTSMI